MSQRILKEGGRFMPTVKIGRSRQVTIPKKLFEALALKELKGDRGGSQKAKNRQAAVDDRERSGKSYQQLLRPGFWGEEKN